jgi:hypothetical protein
MRPIRERPFCSPARRPQNPTTPEDAWTLGAQRVTGASLKQPSLAPKRHGRVAIFGDIENIRLRLWEDHFSNAETLCTAINYTGSALLAGFRLSVPIAGDTSNLLFFTCVEKDGFLIA